MVNEDITGMLATSSENKKQVKKNLIHFIQFYDSGTNAVIYFSCLMAPRKE